MVTHSLAIDLIAYGRNPVHPHLTPDFTLLLGLPSAVIEHTRSCAMGSFDVRGQRWPHLRETRAAPPQALVVRRGQRAWPKLAGPR